MKSSFIWKLNVRKERNEINMEKHFIIAAKTDVGNCKQVNQDSFTAKVAKTAIGEIAFAVICDGMGGLEQGEVASTHVVKESQRWFEQSFTKWMEQGMDQSLLMQQWKQLIDACNTQIAAYGKKEGIQVGTTATFLLLLQDMYYIAHVGDCRVYEMRNGLRQITTDQTFIEREVALGHMTKEQALNDARKNVLLQCIGVNPEVSVDYLCGKVEPDTSFLLCSDGFRHELTTEELMQYACVNLKHLNFSNASREDMHAQMKQQLEYLAELAKSRGEKDNLSAILVKCI